MAITTATLLTTLGVGAASAVTKKVLGGGSSSQRNSAKGIQYNQGDSVSAALAASGGLMSPLTTSTSEEQDDIAVAETFDLATDPFELQQRVLSWFPGKDK